MSIKRVPTQLTTFAAAAVMGWLTLAAAQAAELNIKDVPLFLSESAAPLNMLVVGRDHKLYYEAYNDASDLDGDGTIETNFKPDLTYFGYFNSDKCYTHDGSKFVPAGNVLDAKLRTCKGQWSGNWLNYVTTARIDALHKVLYGGYRSTDTKDETVLQRAHIPHDAHSWVKEYRGTAAEGYDITKYTPLSQPSAGKTHLFANVTLMTSADWTTNGPASNPPLLRVAQNVNGPNNRAWHWGSTESPVAGICYARDDGTEGRCENHGGTGKRIDYNSTLTDYPVRVKVCAHEPEKDPSCRRYPSGNYKPVGLLQEYGENGKMKFGLLTGSYQRSKSGGVLRKGVDDLSDEINIDTDGTFKNFNGIIATLGKLRSVGYSVYRTDSWYREASNRGGGTVYNPGLVTTRPFNEGEFGGMWGNPIAEMMYEALRYFAGRSGPTSAFDYGDSGFDVALGLPKVKNWKDPYADPNPRCAKPFMTVISDINPSYDTDQLPGTSYSEDGDSPAPGDDLGGLNVSTEATTIWNAEFGGPRNIFIGQSGTGANSYDGAPTSKTASSFATIRGLAPEEPTKRGGYYAASVAKFGLQNDINKKAKGDQKVQTFAVALASPLPRIEIPVNGSKVTLAPFAKSVAGSGINKDRGQFQPTNQIVDYYVESISADGTSGSFLINFEDVEAGNDHDMDTVVRYSYRVVDGLVEVTVERLYEAGGITHHMGYVISGTQGQDGIYLVVQDDNSDHKYFLDTPAGKNPGDCMTTLCPSRPSSPRALPHKDTRQFTPGTSPGMLLKDPLWYAAKWGGFKDLNNSGTPDQEEEWNSNKDPAGNPDNYFLVTNALTLKQQLMEAFDSIARRTAAASAASVNSGTINEDTVVYQARFTSGEWSGDVIAQEVFTGDDPNTDVVERPGQLGKVLWRASQKIPAPNARKIFTVDSEGAKPFSWDGLDDTSKALLTPDAESDAERETLGKDRVRYLRGDRTLELRNGGRMRDRSLATVLGDIVSSSPVYVGAPRAFYRDSLEPNAPYSAFKAAQKDRTKMIYAGANDGMLHAFNAEDGSELWAYIPSPVFKNLHALTKPDYSHLFYVDGHANAVDAYVNGSWKTVLVGGLNKGGQGIYALDVTNPVPGSESAAASMLMWEFTDADDADLGYTYSRPAVVRMRDGNWYAVFGNGYNNTEADGRASTTGEAVLYAVKLADKTVIKMSTGFGASHPEAGGLTNGLASPAVVDIDDDGIADVAYAGDLHGNLWKFTFQSANPSDWKVANAGGEGNPAPLFVARDPKGNRQPITSRPQVGFGPRGEGLMVLFGTGKFLEDTDRIVSDSNPSHTFYGLWDRNRDATNDVISGRDKLLQQTIIAETTAPDGSTVRVTTDNALNGQLGWYLDLLAPGGLYEGEMQVTNSVLRNRRVLFTTLIPSPDPCDYGGTSWLMQLDYLSGARISDPPFDINGDGEFNEKDSVGIDTDGDGNPDESVPASGVKSENGIWAGIGVVSDNNEETLYLPGSNNQEKTGDGCDDGVMDCVSNKPPANAYGRQSWRQLR